MLGKEAKKKRIEVVGNIEKSLMKTDLDEFKDLISMPIDFVIVEKFSYMIEKINLSFFFLQSPTKKRRRQLEYFNVKPWMQFQSLWILILQHCKTRG